MLLQVIIIFGLVAGVMTTFNHQYQNMTKGSETAQIKSILINNQKYLLSAMEIDKAWEKTIALNQNDSAFDCIKNPALACSGNGQFQFIDAAGTPLTGMANQNPGFTYSGEICVGFDSVNGNKDCPIGVTLSFEKICSAGCSDPIMKVFIEYEHKLPSKALIINTAQFKKEFIRSPYGQNVLAHREIYNTDPGVNTPGPFTNNEVSETFSIEEDGIMIITASTKIVMQPNGTVDAENITILNSALTLEVDGVPVAISKSTTITNSEAGVGNNSECSRYVSWTQKVSKGSINLSLKVAGWIGLADPTLPITYPEVIFTNLAYTVLK